MADRKNYNGLRGSSLQLPIGSQIASPDERFRQLIAQQMRAMSQEIYMRRASSMVSTRTEEQIDSQWLEEMARQSDAAAKAYFVGIGVITVEQPAETDSPAAE